MAIHNDLGRLGESLAVGYLLENNYVILERNWRFHKAEIDIIAKKEAQIKFWKRLVHLPKTHSWPSVDKTQFQLDYTIQRKL